MSSDERRRVERRLEERLEELARTRSQMRRSGEGMRDSELAHVDNHPGDLGGDLYDEELDETTQLFLEEEKRRIAEAREALADGSYGSCRECEQPIPAERLEAMPEAVRCIACQRRIEAQRAPA